MLISDYRRLGPVDLPHKGRSLRMHPFDLGAVKLPRDYEDYLRPVSYVCRVAGATEGTAYLTVDEKTVEAGAAHRKPGPHVDGCWMPSSSVWDHMVRPSWNHKCNLIPGRMPIIVAASVAGCIAWRGKFKGEPKADGDLSHIADQLTDGEILPANVAYILSPDCVHESMKFTEKTTRTFMRIALPVGFPWEGTK